MPFRCDQNGPPARREKGASRSTFYIPGALGLQGSMKVGRDVTDERRGRRPIFIATLGAAASWLFFGVARSLRPAPFLRWGEKLKSAGLQKWCGMLVVTASPARTALKNSQLTCGERHAISGTGHQHT